MQQLSSDPGLIARWDATPLACTVLGVDTFDPAAADDVTLDSSAVGAHLAGRTAHARFFIATSSVRDHPYNLARRVASLGHLTRGRSGIMFGVNDAREATVRAVLDAARAVRALEQSWPYESIVADRDRRILVESDRISHVDLDGTYSIAGPLNVPEPRSGASVISWYAPEHDRVPVAGPIEFVFGAGGSVLFVGLDQQPDAQDGNVIVRPGPHHHVADALDVADRWFAAGAARTPLSTSLREALGLPAIRRPDPVRPAFPVPQTQPSL